MVTLKQIAEACNLSTAAVSKALRGEKDISEKTRQMVSEKAKEMGYSPNFAAVRLRTKRSYTIGVIINDQGKAGVTHNFFSGIFNHLAIEAEKNGYTVTLLTDKLGANHVTYLECAAALGCDGIVILVDKFDSEITAEIARCRIPIVVIDYSVNNCTSIFSDNGVGMGELVKYVYEMGHRSYALIVGEDIPLRRQRLASFHRACEALGVVVPDSRIFQGAFHNTEVNEALTYQIMALDNPPTVIFYPDDFASIGGRNALAKLGLSCPDDVSIVGYDGLLISRVSHPSLVTWAQNTKEMGTLAMRSLLNAIENPKTYLPEVIEVQGCFLAGESVRNLNIPSAD